MNSKQFPARNSGLEKDSSMKQMSRCDQNKGNSTAACPLFHQPQVSIVACLEACTELKVYTLTYKYLHEYLELCVWLMLSLLPAIYTKLLITVEIVFFQAADQHQSASLANQQLISHCLCPATTTTNLLSQNQQTSSHHDLFFMIFFLARGIKKLLLS